jgi:hypothetical protein
MRFYYFNVPLVGEFVFEWGSLTRARGGRYVDGSRHRGGFEVWLGRLHVVVDRPKTSPAPLLVAATAAYLIYSSGALV